MSEILDTTSGSIESAASVQNNQSEEVNSKMRSDIANVRNSLVNRKEENENGIEDLVCKPLYRDAKSTDKSLEKAVERLDKGVEQGIARMLELLNDPHAELEVRFNGDMEKRKELGKFVQNFTDSALTETEQKLVKYMMAATLLADMTMLDKSVELANAVGVSRERLKELAISTRSDYLWSPGGDYSLHVGTNLSILNGFVGSLGGSLIRGLRK